MIEKQVIVNWYKPDQKLPPDGEAVPATVSGKSGSHYIQHALVTAEFYEGEGWFVEGFDTDKKGAWLVVHAWADLEPYEVNKKQSKELAAAIRVLKEMYAQAQTIDFIRNPMVRALYDTWRHFDEKSEAKR